MTSWLSWPIDVLARRMIEPGERERINRALAALRADEVRYLDEESWAELRGIEIDEARRELEEGVERRLFERGYLYKGDDSPVTFVVPKERLGTSVWLSEIGDFSESEDREVQVSSYRSVPVYIAASSAAGG